MSSNNVFARQQIDFYDVINPVIIIYRLFGLTHYKLKSDKHIFGHSATKRLIPSELTRYANILQTAIQWLLVVKGFQDANGPLNNLPIIMESLQTTGSVLVSFTTPIFFWKDGRLLIEIIQGLYAVDKHLHVNYAKLRNEIRLTIAILGIFTICNWASGVCIFLYVRKQFRIGWFRISVYSVSLLMTNTVLLTFYVFLLQLKHRYSMLMQSTDCNTAMHVYNELWIMGRKLNDFANVHLLLQFCMAYLYMLTCGFFCIYINILNTYYFLFTIGTWVLSVFLMTGIPIWLFHSTQLAAEDVRAQLSAQHKDLMVQQQLVFEDNAFHVFHCFPINLNFSLIMIGSLSTNLLILWQFQRMMKL